MPAPAAATAASVVPKRRGAQTPAPKSSAEAITPSDTRAVGPIQPRSTASTKKKTTPSTVTAPPVRASARAPSHAEKSNEGASKRGRGGGGGGAWRGGA